MLKLCRAASVLIKELHLFFSSPSINDFKCIVQIPRVALLSRSGILAHRQDQFDIRLLIFCLPSVSHVICLQYSAAWRITQNSISDSIVQLLSMSAGSWTLSVKLDAAGLCTFFGCAPCGACLLCLVVCFAASVWAIYQNPSNEFECYILFRFLHKDYAALSDWNAAC